jgi:dihydropteroate synthase
VNALTPWNIRGGRLQPAPFFIMGVVNATPDSFFDGGNHYTPDKALAHARRLAGEGAHILDVGGESSRPGAAPVSVQEELERVLPVIEGLTGLEDSGTSTPVVSVDTYKAETAARALEAGASVVNDISACAFDPRLIDVLAQYKPGYVLMHCLARPGVMQHAPAYGDVVEEIKTFFQAKLAELTAAGLPEQNIVLDPGIGFGKKLEHNLAILARMEEFMEFDRPLLVGLSNKSLWGDLLGLPTEQRSQATQAATALMAARGVRIHRVHDVVNTVKTLKIVEAVARPE